MTNIKKNISLLFYTLIPLFLSSSLTTSITTSTSTSTTFNQSYIPPDNFALNCGDDGEVIAGDGRKWTGDVSSNFLSSQHNQHSSTSSSTASTQDFAPQVPYMTARVFHTRLTYTFPLTQLGPVFIRLHFHPTSYSTLPNISQSYFTVTLNNYILLRNFSTLLTSRYLNTTYFVKEFYFNIVSEPILNISFVPTSPTALGYVNGIEVLSIPGDLYVTSDKNIPNVGQSQPLIIDNSTALEMVYRLNVDGQAIMPKDDAGGMFRGWAQDIDYIYGAAVGQDPYHFTINIKYTKVPPHTAPEILYRTARSMGTNAAVNENYNLTWLFPVDSGFYYLVRMHFCEISPEITGINQRVFQIFLNNQTAENEMDIMVDAEGIGVPIYKDFIVTVPGTGCKINLWLALHPNTRAHARYSDALLNGLEIFKLNKSDGSLAGLNPALPDPVPELVNPSMRKPEHPNKIRVVFIVAGAILTGTILLCVLFFFRRRSFKSGSGSGKWFGVWFLESGSDITKTKSLPSDLSRRFSLAEIKSATDDFSADLLIGVGGFGNVYKGYIEDGLTPVAIKRLNPESQQGAHEFRTEIETLSQLRHVHLVSLIGYCEDHNEMILVYDYMTRGTLRDHLYNTDNPPLPWKLRLQICIGAARGLHYLHTGAKYTIIHRDVKTTNVLIDEKWMAKVSDFGLSRVGPTHMSHTHVSTVVKGSFGYLDPEYFRRQQLTDKSDVYSFGVVLFEVLCAKPVLDKNMKKDEICLSDWAQAHYKKGKLDQIIDPYLRGKIAPECLKKFGEVANKCLLDKGIDRPTMGEVVWNLEFALQLQESLEESGDFKGVDDGEETLFYASFVSLRTNSDVNSVQSTSDSTLGMSGTVFSEIINPKAR